MEQSCQIYLSTLLQTSTVYFAIVLGSSPVWTSFCFTTVVGDFNKETALAGAFSKLCENFAKLRWQLYSPSCVEVAGPCMGLGRGCGEQVDITNRGSTQNIILHFTPQLRKHQNREIISYGVCYVTLMLRIVWCLLSTIKYSLRDNSDVFEP